MGIYVSLGKYEFVDYIRNNDTYKNMFSYEGLIALYDYINDEHRHLFDDSRYELDFYVLTEEFTEYSIEEFKNDFTHIDVFKEVDNVDDLINIGVHLIELDSDRFITVNFDDREF